MELKRGGILRRVAAALAVPAIAAAAVLAAVVLLSDAERDAAEEARVAHAAAVEARELERGVAALERQALRFVVTGRQAPLAAYEALRESLAAAAPGVGAYVREELAPVVALARRDRREARIAVARGDVRSRADELMQRFHALADARAAGAAAADDRAAARADDLRLVAIAGGGAVLLLALASAVLLWRSVRRPLHAGGLATRMLLSHKTFAAALAGGGEPDDVLRRFADALSAEAGALYLRSGDAPFRLAAVRGVDDRALGDELLAHGLAGRAVVEGRAVPVSYPDATLVVRAHGQEVALRHELHIPLCRAGEVVGVITLGRLTDAQFTDDDVRLGELLASQAAAVVGQAAAQRRPPSMREVDLVRLTRESVEAARAEAEERGVAITLELEGVPRSIGDPDRISLALDELVARAMAAAGPGGRVDARLFPRAGTAVVELTVDPGAVAGLELARSIFEDHGGAVLVEGPAGGRAAFRVELPLRVAGRS